MVDKVADRTAPFLHEPRSEQELVCLFGALLDHLGIQIESVGTAFPDAIVRRAGKPLRVEFELYGKTFWDHGHDPDKCDLLICWHDNWGGQWSFEVIELREIVEENRPGLVLSTATHPRFWDQQTFLEQGRQDSVPESELELARKVMILAAEYRMGPQWLGGPKGVFAVGDRTQYFKVSSRGSLRFPFCRLGAGERFPELASRLNQVLPSLSLQPSDAFTKRKGGLLSELFREGQQLRDFFEVWRWYRGS